MRWSDRYLGIPFVSKGRTLDGWDCWAVVMHVLKAECGVDVPSYTEAYAGAAEQAEIAATLEANAFVAPWQPVEIAKPFDVALFSRGRHAQHVGIVVEPGLMLHVTSDIGETVIESYTNPKWSRRLIGIYRHQEMM